MHIKEAQELVREYLEEIGYTKIDTAPTPRILTSNRGRW
jgi:hypothetical protein